MTLTNGDIYTLNEARRVLNRIAQDGGESPSKGRVAGAAHLAEHATFMVLNFTNSYVGQELTAEQLYGRAQTRDA